MTYIFLKNSSYDDSQSLFILLSPLYQSHLLILVIQILAWVWIHSWFFFSFLFLILKNFFIDSFRVSHHAPHFHASLSPPFFPSLWPCTLHIKKQFKVSNQKKASHPPKKQNKVHKNRKISCFSSILASSKPLYSSWCQWRFVHLIVYLFVLSVYCMLIEMSD